MLKILVIINDLDIGGAQNYTISLLNGFYEKGVAVKLIVLSQKTPLIKRLNPNIPVSIYPRKRKLDFSVIRNIRREIRNDDYDAIISSYAFYTRLALLNLKILTIYPVHSTKELAKKAFFINLFDYQFKKSNEIFVSTIKKQTEYLVKHYFLRDDFFTMIFNGVDTEKFTLPPADFNKKNFLSKFGINSDNKIILKVAGFREEKRHIDAIKAFAQVYKNYKNISLLMVGDKRIEIYNQLNTFINNNNIHNVFLFPDSLIEDIRYFYWSADFFLLTSNKVETFPISALEAMSVGLPCVLTDVGGNADIIHDGFNGYLVKPDDINSISDGIEKMLNELDSVNNNSIRNNVIDNYSLQNSVNSFLKVVEDHYVVK